MSYGVFGAERVKLDGKPKCKTVMNLMIETSTRNKIFTLLRLVLDERGNYIRLNCVQLQHEI